MKSMEQFGQQLVSYEGVADVDIGTDTGKIDFSGYFEAAQFPSGRLTVNIVSTNPHRLTGDTGDTSLDDSRLQLSFQGDSLDGWTIECGGRNYFLPFNWVIALMTHQPAERSFHPQYLVARRRAASGDGYPRAQFLVCNLLWHQGSDNEPEPIELKALNYNISIHPVETYIDVARGLTNTHGIGPTALVTIESKGSTPEPMESFKNLMDDLVYVLRLTTGNSVSWYYGEAVEERTERPIERIHQQALTRPYSNTLKFRPLSKGYQSLVPKINLQALTEAFFNESKNVLEKDALKALINQFTNTCEQTSYLEMRGLLSSTLTDLLASKFAHERGASEAIPQAEYETVHLPLLKEAIDNSDWSGHVKNHLKQSLRGGYRAFFSQRLKLLNKGLRIGLSDCDIKRIVKTRNALVHEVTYKSTFEEGDWLNEYRFLTWTNLCALCRLTGYEGELPTFQAGDELEV